MTAAVDWSRALVVAGGGFGTVFVVLTIVAVAMWVVGLAIRRAGSKGDKQNSTGS